MRYLESNLPEHILVRVTHIHSGNSKSRRERARLARTLGLDAAASPRYVTIANLYDGSYEEPELIASAVAACSPKDAPCRSTGRAIAVGRAMKAAGLPR